MEFKTEEEIFRCWLDESVRVRIFVKGVYGRREVENFIRLLELQRDFLDDAAPEESATA